MRTLAEGVSLHVIEADAPGPTALVQAGIHGDEVAGVLALRELLDEGIAPRRGRLLVVPVMNPAALAAGTRTAPGGLDLNRCFPGDASAPEPERRLARRFMDLVLAERPALVATLHESRKRYDPAVVPSFGQTLVIGVQPPPAPVVQVVERMNASLEDPAERWEVLHYPVPTSSTEVIVEATGCVGTCVETWMGFPLARRVQMQRQVVGHLLDAIGVGWHTAC